VIESIDVLKPGMYLVCSKGQEVSGVDYNGVPFKNLDRRAEGTLARVVAISPPIVILEWFPLPCGDMTHMHVPYPVTMVWNRLGWSVATRSFVREYRKMIGLGRKRRIKDLNRWSIDQVRKTYPTIPFFAQPLSPPPQAAPPKEEDEDGHSPTPY